MSKLKISSNLFLEVEELNRLVRFLEEDGWKRTAKAMVGKFGIIENTELSPFRVYRDTKKGEKVISINPGVALDSNLDGIVIPSTQSYTIEDTGNTRWVVLSRATTNWENSLVSIGTDGTITETSGNAFSEVLRGQPNFPVKIKFNSANNPDEYEVVSVDGNSAVITGAAGAFIAENNIQWAVIGTFTPGFVPLEENKYIYEYDSFTINLIDSETRPVVDQDNFILARIAFVNDIPVVYDERTDSMFALKTSGDTGGGDTGGGDTGESDTKVETDPLVSLLAVGLAGGKDAEKDLIGQFELIVEHGYKINSFNFVGEENYDTIVITSGSCNFLGTGNIADDYFKDWIILNRENMQYSIITGNTNKTLRLDNLNPDVINSDSPDLVIVPNCSEIEFEVKLSGNVTEPNTPFYFRKSIQNLYSRLPFHAFYPQDDEDWDNSITVNLRYRLITGTGMAQTAFQKFAIANYTDIDSVKKPLSNSSFNIVLSNLRPEEEERDYS